MIINGKKLVLKESEELNEASKETKAASKKSLRLTDKELRTMPSEKYNNIIKYQNGQMAGRILAQANNEADPEKKKKLIGHANDAIYLGKIAKAKQLQAKAYGKPISAEKHYDLSSRDIGSKKQIEALKKPDTGNHNNDLGVERERIIDKTAIHRGERVKDRPLQVKGRWRHSRTLRVRNAAGSQAKDAIDKWELRHKK